MAAEWREVSVADIAGREGLVGGPFGSELGRADYVKSGVPVIRGANLAPGEGRFDASDLVFVTEEKADSLSPHLAIAGDIIVTQRGTLGQVGLIPSNSPYPRWLVSQSQMRLRCDPEVADPLFVYAWLRAPQTIQAIRARAIVTGVPHINLRIFRALRLWLPPREEQRKIARILGAFDEKIDLLRRTCGTLEATCRALFSSLGAERRGFRATTLGAEAARCGGKIQTGPFGSQLHASDYVAEGVPVVMPKDIEGRRISTANIAKIRESDAERLGRHRLEMGDLVYSRRGDVGRHALIGKREAGFLCGTGSILVRLGPGFPSPMFASFALDRPEARAWIKGRAIGATMSNLNTTLLSALPLLVPPLDALESFESIARPIQDRIDLAYAECEKLAATRDALLPRLVSGELRVSLDNEEQGA